MIIVLDTETTGVNAAGGDTVVEIAAVPLTQESAGQEVWRLGQGHSSLVAPGRSIPPAARAVHHLSDDELRGAPKLSLALTTVLRDCGAVRPMGVKHEWLVADVVAAHNAAFDRGFVGQFFEGRQLQWLCTWRCSLHLWPDAPTHTNQGLRYYVPGLDAQVHETLASYTDQTQMLPHRALYDTITTAHILKRMLEEHALERLLDLQNEPVLQMKCRFGKHRGVNWGDVPKDYLKWLLRQDNPPFDRDVIHTAQHWSRQ